MQVTIELTMKEYRQIEQRVRGAIAMKPAGVTNIPVTDQILARICEAVRDAGKETSP